MLDTLFTAVTILLSNNDPGGYILALAAVGPTTAVIFFKRMHKKYRNFDETHGFEKETSVKWANMKVRDAYDSSRKKTKDAHVIGHNSDNHRIRVQQF
jgi:hypothetical protein